MSEHQLAQHWNKSVRTLQRWRTVGCGPAYFRIGQTIYYRPETSLRSRKPHASTGARDDLTPAPRSNADSYDYGGAAVSDAQSITLALRGRWHGRYGLAFCPVHDNRRTPALRLANGSDGRLLTLCSAGCTFELVVGMLRGMGLRNNSVPSLFSNANWLCVRKVPFDNRGQFLPLGASTAALPLEAMEARECQATGRLRNSCLPASFSCFRADFAVLRLRLPHSHSVVITLESNRYARGMPTEPGVRWGTMPEEGVRYAGDLAKARRGAPYASRYCG